VKRRLAAWFRKWADRLDNEGAPKRTSWSFTFEEGWGAVFNQAGRGCPLYYFGQDDYERAHAEQLAESKPDDIEWITVGTRTPDGGVHVFGSARVVSGETTRRMHGYLEGKVPGARRPARVPLWRVTLKCEVDNFVSLPGDSYQRAVERMFGRHGIDG
jgi:hypothetical protein